MQAKTQTTPRFESELWVVQKATIKSKTTTWKTITKPQDYSRSWGIFCRKNADVHRLLTGVPNLMVVGAISIEMMEQK